MWRTLLAGMFDAGFSSVATLAVGVYAARTLPQGEFGIYALFNSAFLFATVLPSYLVLAPAAIATVSLAPKGPQRLGLAGQTLRLGTPPGLLAAVLATAAASAGAGAPLALIGPLSITSGLCAVLSPMQDQVRRALHMGDRSGSAAIVSLIQLGTVAAGLAVLPLASVGAVWRPFTALGVANAFSMATGLVIAHWGRTDTALPDFGFRELMGSGRWLLAHHLAMAGGFFISSAIIAQVAGPVALGQAEAARLVAQPLFVLSTALQSVTWPASMEAAANRDPVAARRVARLFVGLMIAAGALYAAVTTAPWAGNLLARVLPEAYEVRGLVLVSVVAHVLLGSFNPHANELVAAGRSRDVAVVGGVAGVLQCGAAAGALLIGAFARPVGMAVFSAAVLLGYQPYRRRIYRG